MTDYDYTIEIVNVISGGVPSTAQIGSSGVYTANISTDLTLASPQAGILPENIVSGGAQSITRTTISESYTADISADLTLTSPQDGILPENVVSGGTPDITQATIHENHAANISADLTLTSPQAGILPIESVSIECTRAFFREFDENIGLRDVPIINGIIPQDTDDDLTITDAAISVSPVKLFLDLDDSVVIDDQIAKTEFVAEDLKLREGFAIKHFIPGKVYTVEGVHIRYGSEVPVEGAVVHVIKRYTHPTLIENVNLYDVTEVVHIRNGGIISTSIDAGTTIEGPIEPEIRDLLPRGNAPEYTSVTQRYGLFTIENLPAGVYTLVSMKPGYSHGFVRLDLNDDTKDDPVILTMYQLRPWEYVERPYNKLGHLFKIYFYGDGIYTDGNRVVDGYLVFGDLYNTSAGAIEGYRDEKGNLLPGAPNVSLDGKIVSDGKLHCDDTYTIGWLDLLPFPFTGYMGAFEIVPFEPGMPLVPDESVELSKDLKTIEWKSTIRFGEFDGFAFRYVFNRNMTGVLYFSLGTPLVIPGEGTITNPADPSSPISPTETSPSSPGGSPGSSGSSGGSGGGGGGWSGGRYWNPWWIWRPQTSYIANERIYVKDDVLRIKTEDEDNVGNRYFCKLYDAMYSQDLMSMPPDLTITGVVTGMVVTRFKDEETGDEWTVTLYDAPISGAHVVLRVTRTGEIIGEATTGEDGVWSIGGLPSEMEYEIYIFDTRQRYYSTVIKTIVHDKNLIDSRTRVLLEGEIFGNETGVGYEYYEAKIIIPPLNVRLDYDGRIYGLVKDEATGKSIVGALVRAIPGHLTQEEVDNYTGAEMYTFMTFERDYVDSGFYEIYLPCGEYTLQALARGYDDSDLYYGDVQAGWHQIITMRGGSVSGIVYDGPSYGAGILKPLEGAVVTFGEFSATTDSDGKFHMVVGGVEVGKKYDITCSKTDYVTATKRIQSPERSIKGVMFALWPVSAYTRRPPDQQA